MPEPIRIRVGAALDSSVNQVFSTIEKRGARAQKNLNKEQKRGSREGKRQADKLADDYTEAMGKIGRVSKARFKGIKSAFEETTRAAERELKKQTAATRREADAQTRALKRAQAQGPARTGQAFARRTSFAASRFLTPRAPIGSLARRAVSDIARGTGVRTDLSGSLANVVDQERIATRISNKAFRPGESGAAGIRQDPKKIQNEAREAAKSVGASTAELLEGLSLFTSQSGDLETARGSMQKLAELARSQGASMQNVFFAAGKVNNALEAQPEFMGQTEKRSKEVFKILNLLTAQTKIGSVEMEKLAAQLPKVSGLAPLFEGQVGGSLGKLTTVLQVAEKGQAQNAATAATQTSAFVKELVKGPVAARFAKAGIETVVQTGKDRGKNRDIQAVIKDILVRSSEAVEGGDVGSRKQFVTALVKNSRAFLPLLDFLVEFEAAGGGGRGGKGEKRIDVLFEKFSKGITEKQLKGDLAAVLDTTEAKAQQFNIQLEEVVDKMSTKLLPALERVGPKFLELAEVMGDLTTFMLENPKATIGLAISASIARAGIESTLRAGIERLILGPNVAGGAAGGVTGSRAGRVGAIASKAGGALTIAALAVTTLTVGKLLVDSIFEAKADEQRKKIANDIEKFNIENKIAQTGSISAEDAEKIKGRGQSIKGRLAQSREQGTLKGAAGAAFGLSPFGLLLDFATGGKGVGTKIDQLGDIFNTEELQRENQELQEIMKGVRDGTIKVSIVEDKTANGGDGVDQSGRTEPQ